MSDLTIELDAFVRSFGINRATPHAFFLGAGASISSGMPSAEMCIREWKRSIFLTKNPGLELQFRELSLECVRAKIQKWLDAQGIYPAAGSLDEYGIYIEACYPIPEDRRKFFQGKVRGARPQSGYRVLAALAEAGAVGSVWTTNFDALAVRAAAEFNLTPVEVGIDTQHRAFRASAAGELLCVSLHGDYRYDALKNTSAEVQQQEEALRRALVAHVHERPLIVSGYSGRDASIMAALIEAYSRPGSGALYWCGFRGTSIPLSVTTLLEAARTAGRTAFYVETAGFDDLVLRLGLHCLDGERGERARALAAGSKGDDWPKAAFALPEAPPAELIKSNAFEVTAPAELLAFELTEWPKEKVWAWLEEATAGRDVVAVPFNRKVLALGTIADIRDAFGPRIKGPIERVPVADDDLSIDDGAVASLLKRALLRAMASSCGLSTDSRAVLWIPDTCQRRGEYRAFESAVVFLRKLASKLYVILKPSIRIEDSGGHEAPEDISRKLKVEILGWQHNGPFNQVLRRWMERLFPVEVSKFEYPPDRGSEFRFQVRRAPVFAEIGSRPSQPAITIPDSVRPYVQHRGVQVPEPALLFADRRTGNLVREPYAIRGLVENRPYDYALTRSGVSGPIRVGVVCPAREQRSFAAFLHKVHSRVSPGNNERDYLRDYPGFEALFGVPVEVASPGDPSWHAYGDPPLEADVRTGVSALARSITRAIDALHAATAPNVIVVAVPTRFMKWERFESDEERIDLHDFVKAYCVQKGIATQFIRQQTFDKAQQCRVWWWLSVALYAKSMRTPWLLDSLDNDTAFVGLGFSIDRFARRGEHVVLGCSHLYNARGEGLQYRLTKVEDPIFRGKNCFLSESDARRVGETVRQLFYESKFELPRRVVIHKRAPFLRSEIVGLRRGLEGVAEVEMVEINIDDALRYVASAPKPGGRFEEDRFPVHRGTLVQLAPYEALLWVHGTSGAVTPSRKYYQGKRRIPAPLLLRRYVGSSDLTRIAGEILGLSKMSWNTVDFYTKLPATVLSSNEIAHIGSLLGRFGAVAYDYRLLM